jgi:hypothetical protein
LSGEQLARAPHLAALRPSRLQTSVNHRRCLATRASGPRLSAVEVNPRVTHDGVLALEFPGGALAGVVAAGRLAGGDATGG